MEYMMNLEKSNENNKMDKKNSIDNTDLPKRTSFSQTPQPSLKNVNNDMVRIIEEEINHIADANKQTKRQTTYFFGVKIKLN